MEQAVIGASWNAPQSPASHYKAGFDLLPINLPASTLNGCVKIALTIGEGASGWHNDTFMAGGLSQRPDQGLPLPWPFPSKRAEPPTLKFSHLMLFHHCISWFSLTRALSSLAPVIKLAKRPRTDFHISEANKFEILPLNLQNVRTQLFPQNFCTSVWKILCIYLRIWDPTYCVWSSPLCGLWVR